MDLDKRLSRREVILMLVVAVILGGPAAAMVELNVGPARWIVAAQNELLGFHSVVSSAVLVMGLELLAIAAVILPIALAVRKLTGKTVIELIRGDRVAPSSGRQQEPPR